MWIMCIGNDVCIVNACVSYSSITYVVCMHMHHHVCVFIVYVHGTRMGIGIGV